MFQQAIRLRAESPSYVDDAALEVDPVARLWHLLVTVITFVSILVASVGLTLGIARWDWLPERLKCTYEVGASLIPAWAWKDVVSALVTAAMSARVLEVQEHTGVVAIEAAVLAVLVALLSAALQIWLEMKTQARVPLDAEEATIIPWVMVSLKFAFSLGVGWAVNNVFQSLFHMHWANLWVRLVYVVAVTALVPLAQFRADEILETHQQRLSSLTGKSVGFLVLSWNFVVGWAWKCLLDALLQPLEED